VLEQTGKADEGGNLKLALIGTHGVGKTTLAYEVCSLLKKSHYNVELVAEIARQSPFPVNAETTLEGQLWILHSQITAEIEAAQRAPIVVTDRAVLDNYCYLVNKFGRQPHLETWLAWWMATYSVLIGVPIVEEGIPRDGFRSEDRAFQLRIHDLLIELLGAAPFNNLPAPVIWLDARDRSSWAERIVNAAVPLIEGASTTHLRNRSAR
jgi:GTPase SAR1 family protein